MNENEMKLNRDCERIVKVGNLNSLLERLKNLINDNKLYNAIEVLSRINIEIADCLNIKLNDKVEAQTKTIGSNPELSDSSQEVERLKQLSNEIEVGVSSIKTVINRIKKSINEGNKHLV